MTCLWQWTETESVRSNSVEKDMRLINAFEKSIIGSYIEEEYVRSRSRRSRN
jgi:hypothetical protein